MRLARPSIGPLGNKPHLENIDSDIDSALTTIKVQLCISLLRFYSRRVSQNLYNDAAPTAAALDAALISSPPDEKRAAFSTETTPCQLTQITSQPSSAVATTQLCSRNAREYPRAVSTQTELNLSSRQLCTRLDRFFMPWTCYTTTSNDAIDTQKQTHHVSKHTLHPLEKDSRWLWTQPCSHSRPTSN